MAHLVLFSTTDLLGSRHETLERLVRSVTTQTGASITVRMFLLLQNSSEETRNEWARALPGWISLHACSGRLSLSAARNQLLEIASRERLFDTRSVVGFPDDDCWYPETFLGKLARAFADDGTLDLLVCGVSLKPVEPDWHTLDRQRASLPTIVRKTSSNNMFFRGDLFEQIGRFDPELGLGTPNFGGEDTDVVMRAYMRSRRSIFVDQPLVGHPTSTVDSIAKYFRGSLLVLARHAHQGAAFSLEYSRKILVGAYLVATRRLSVAEYERSVRNSIGELARRLAERRAEPTLPS